MNSCRGYLQTYFPSTCVFYKHFIHSRIVQSSLNMVSRTLLSESATKMEQFKRQRIFRLDYLQQEGKAQLFKTLENCKSSDEAQRNISNLFDATHCAESREDTQIIDRTLQLIMTSTETGAKDYSFGASVIRMYYNLNMPDEAFASYKNHVCSCLFKDNTCHLLLMDLLYKNRQYSRAVEMFFAMEKFNIECATLLFGALYHINSPESFTKSQSLLIHLATKYAVSKRAVLFASMLALNQGDPRHALESLKFCKPDTVAKNIELICLCKLRNTKKVKSHLYAIVDKTEDISKLWSLRIYQDAWQEVLTFMESSGSLEDRKEYENIKSELEYRGVLSQQTTSVFLNKTLPSDNDYKKERAKRIIHRISKKPS